MYIEDYSVHVRPFKQYNAQVLIIFQETRPNSTEGEDMTSHLSMHTCTLTYKLQHTHTHTHMYACIYTHTFQYNRENARVFTCPTPLAGKVYEP